MSDEPASVAAGSPPGQSARRFWAVFFALIWPSGPGHLLIGQKRRAWAWAGAIAGFLLVAELATVATGNGRFMMAGIAGLLAFHILSAIDVSRLERKYPLPSVGSFIGNFVLLVGSLSLFAVGLRATLVEAFQIPSDSMFPTLHVGDHIFVNKRVRQFARGDVAVFAYPLDHDVKYLKRVIGVGGDVIETSAGQLTINGRPVERRELDEPCADHEGNPCKLFQESFDGRSWVIAEELARGPRDMPAVNVPPGHYYVIGDNRDNSSDSRVWGFVDQDLMRGKAISIWQSSKDDGSIDWSRINMRVR